MGQKANPNSFHSFKKTAVTFGSNHQTIEYSTLLKEYLSVSGNLVTFFEKNNCIVKDCFFTQQNEKSFITLFINFLVLKRRTTKNKRFLGLAKDEFNIPKIVQKFFSVLSNFGYPSSKRLILQNLNKTALKHQKTFFSKEYAQIKKELNSFTKEIYFDAGLFLFCLMNTTKETSSLLSKFVARFFKLFHRSKKINKFLLFLAKFVENVDSNRFKGSKIKGLKIQIKGRFKGVPRSKTRLFEKGSIPLQTIDSKINYSLTHITTSYGVFGIKVWIFE
jgi:hypothetical protein